MPKLTASQQSVIRGLNDLGRPVTDAALATYVHHMDVLGQSSSSVRTRRCELERRGLIREAGRIQMKSGRYAATHTLTAKGRKAADRVAS